MDNKLRDTVAVRFSKYYISKIDSIIENGVFKNRSDLVRTATAELINKVEVHHYQRNLSEPTRDRE